VLDGQPVSESPSVSQSQSQSQSQTSHLSPLTVKGRSEAFRLAVYSLMIPLLTAFVRSCNVSIILAQLVDMWTRDFQLN